MPRSPKQRKLLSNWLLCIFVVLVAVTGKVASQESTKAKPISSGELANSETRLENVTLIGKVIGKKTSRGDIGVVLELEGVDGYQYSAFISQDVESVPLSIGSRVQLVGSSIGSGALAVTTPHGVKLLKEEGGRRTITGVNVHNGTASWQAGHQIANTSTDVPDGYYPELVMITDSTGRRTLEKP